MLGKKRNAQAFSKKNKPQAEQKKKRSKPIYP
jgi:hypothetical protein